MRLLKFLLLCIGVVYILPAALAALLWWSGGHPASWRDADWKSSGVLPAADGSAQAALYVLSARTGGLKGAVSEHSWIVVKNPGNAPYERWDKVGWGSPIRRNAYPADGLWYSNTPRIILARTGPAAEALIPNLRAAIAAYPFAKAGGYRIFPGPNSNTFIAHVLRHVPGLTASLSPLAIGRDYPSEGRLAFYDRDRGDLRLSVYGYAGVTIGRSAGLELNLLGLVAGVDPGRLAITIPAFGTFALLPDTA